MLMFNLDSDCFLYSRKDIIDSVDEDYLKRFIDQYRDTDVTDFLMCINITLAAYPSKLRTSYADKYLRTEEFGQKVDYRDSVAREAYVLWNEKKLDMYKIWIDRLREDGINPWLSFRMNDAHVHFEAPHVILSDGFYEHINDWSRIRHRKQCQYYDRCEDYSLEAVRAEWIAFITEAVDRYSGAYGIELDFQREFECFRPGGECEGLAIMTEFVREVRRLTSARGMKLAVRCHADPKLCIELGFDIARWAKEGLIDSYIASPRWRTTDNDMPVYLWKQLLEPYGVELDAAVELLLESDPASKKFNFNTVETFAGSAAAYFSQGADKVYAFNYFDIGERMIDDQVRAETNAGMTNSAAPVGEPHNYYKWMTSVGTREHAVASARRHVVTYNDVGPIWRTVVSEIPKKIGVEPQFVRVLTGDIPAGREVTLKLGINGAAGAGDFDVYVNSRPVKYIPTGEPEPPKYTDSPVYSYDVSSEALPQAQVVELISRGREFTLDYVEIAVAAEK